MGRTAQLLDLHPALAALGIERYQRHLQRPIRAYHAVVDIHCSVSISALGAGRRPYLFPFGTTR